MEQLHEPQAEDYAAGQPLIRRMRQAVAARAETTSLRATAREVGMSPTGLKKFVGGTAPYTKTVHRLRSWYLQHAVTSKEELSAEDALAAFGVLVHGLPPGAARALAIERMIEGLEQGYVRTGRKVPAWVASARDHFAIKITESSPG